MLLKTENAVEPAKNKDERIFTWLPVFWLPESSLYRSEINERDRKNLELYRRWHEAGLIKITPGEAIDYAFIRRYIVDELNRDFVIKEIAIDRWNALQIATDLSGDGITMVEFGQGFASMAAPVREVERLLLNRYIRHGGHPILRWMAGNTSMKIDAAGNKKPDKEKSFNKIDGIVAGIMAHGRAMILPPSLPGDEGGGVRTIELRPKK